MEILTVSFIGTMCTLYKSAFQQLQLYFIRDRTFHSLYLRTSKTRNLLLFFTNITPIKNTFFNFNKLVTDIDIHANTPKL